MPTLYDVPLSPFGQKVKMALAEKGIAYRSVEPDLGTPDPGLLAANPRAEVPAFEDDGVFVFDSTIILAYVEERWPEPALLPADPARRARLRMIEEICDTQLEAVTFGVTEIVAFERARGEDARRILARAGEDAGRLLGWLERQLGDEAYFTGDRFGYGDLCVFPFVNIAALYKLGPRPDSPLGRWLARVRERDCAAAVVNEAKAAVAGFKAVVAKIRSGEQARVYRDHRLEWLVRAGGLDIVARGLDDGSIGLPVLPR